MEINGFSFCHNAIDSGYPIIEAIEAVQPWVDDICIVDMQSTDTTRQVLSKMGVKIIDGKWGKMAGETLAEAHKLHCLCDGDMIIHFEADEIYPESLLQEIRKQIDLGQYDLAVWRLQLEQNFQRCRWYPEPCHRVFRKGIARKVGHTTDLHRLRNIPIISQRYGYLWDITNCFRDNWLNRVNKQAELRNEKSNYLHVPLHILGSQLIAEQHIDYFLQQEHWEYKQTPFDIPDNLKSLVGVSSYSNSVAYKRLME